MFYRIIQRLYAKYLTWRIISLNREKIDLFTFFLVAHQFATHMNAVASRHTDENLLYSKQFGATTIWLHPYMNHQEMDKCGVFIKAVHECRIENSVGKSQKIVPWESFTTDRLVDAINEAMRGASDCAHLPSRQVVSDAIN